MGSIFIVSTPIGNLEDITFRAVKILLESDIIACEDTRRAGILLQELEKKFGILFQVKRNSNLQFLRYDNYTEQNSTIEIITAVEKGKNAALISDAGTPLISDPGFYLVREAKKRKITIQTIPGASAVLSALVSSGLPVHTFSFYGFPPEKQTHRRILFESIKEMACLYKQTVIFFLSPHKLADVFTDMQLIFGDQNITICREMTKLHEEIWQGNIQEALNKLDKWKGELVLVFLPNSNR